MNPIPWQYKPGIQSLWMVVCMVAFSLMAPSLSSRGAETTNPPPPKTFSEKELGSWVASIRKAGKKGFEKILPLLESVEGESSKEDLASLVELGGEMPPFAAAELFRGQLDEDPELEVVVQVRFHKSEFEAAGERNEFFWIDIFDSSDAKFHILKKIRQAVWHCNWDQKNLGLTLGFGPATPGSLAHLWIQIQSTSSCGTLVSFQFTKNEYRITKGKLEVKEGTPDEGVDYDRMAPIQEGKEE